MLVLSRKLGEKIRIGDVTLTVVEIKGGRVRLGIEAPANVPILREELQSQEPAPVSLRSLWEQDSEVQPDIIV